MKKILIAIALVLCLLLSACSAAGGKAISDDLLKAFDGTQEEAEKLLNITPEDSGELTGDVTPGTTYAHYTTVQKLCGRDMELYISFQNDVVWAFSATCIYPGADGKKISAECLKMLKDQFGDPFTFNCDVFRDENGQRIGTGINGGIPTDLDAMAANFEDFWTNDTLFSLRYRVDLPPLRENMIGDRSVDVYFYKDAADYDIIQVQINMVDYTRQFENH